MTPADIAADIRRVSPGALPQQLEFDKAGAWYDIGDDTPTVIPDDIAEATLIAAMVQDACLSRWPGGDWVGNQKAFNDADHGGSLQACHAAWRWSKGLDTKETT